MTVVIIIIGLIILGLAYSFFVGQEKDRFVLTDEFKEIINILETTSDCLFISGKAGTGKSTLLKHFTSQTKKRFVILAPTGVAAMNVRGQTIHSFFKFPPRVLDPKTFTPDFTRNALFRNIQMIVIDEISMVNSNLLDSIDASLRINRNNKLPFGGVQMAFIGDLFQLPPVVGNGLQDYFNKTYGGEYFFYCPALKNELKYQKRELTRIFRQKDEQFKEILNRVRVNEATFDDFVKLNSRHISNIGDNVVSNIFLTTTNKIAKKINKENIAKIADKEFIYQAYLEDKIKDDFDKVHARFLNKEITEDEFDDIIDNKFPTNIMLKLRKGCQVMMLKNDSNKNWVNGSLGTVTKLTDDKIWVKLESGAHEIERAEWDEISYIYDAKTNQLKENIKGRFRQFPLKAAWAITIHKSQGKTFDKVTIDIGAGAFSHGQTYVALSRCKTLDGVTLNKEIKQTDVIVDKRIVNYYKNEYNSR